jgi:hypothetical protein
LIWQDGGPGTRLAQDDRRKPDIGNVAVERDITSLSDRAGLCLIWDNPNEGVSP